MNTPRYTEKTVQKFLDYLSEIGLSVYGQAMNDKGEKEMGCMDYDAKTIVLRRKLGGQHDEM